MSYRERFAQVAHDKWANEQTAQKYLSKNLKSYFLVCFILVRLVKKMSDSLIPSFLVCDVSESLRSFIKKWAMWANRSGCSSKMSNHERFAQVAHQKWATMRESLRSLTKNERMRESLVFWENPSFAHFLQKTSDSLRKPLSEFPALDWSLDLGIIKNSCCLKVSV